MNRRWNNNRVSKTFKDYLAPIVIIAIISLLALNYFFSSPTENKNPVWDNTFLTVSLWDADSKWSITYTKWNKVDISSEINKVYQTEKIQSSNGTISITLPKEWWKMTLDRLWELKYNEPSKFTLYSSNLWVDWKADLSIDMRYAKISSKAWSVYSLSQNEVASTIYVVSWVVDVKNLAESQATLQKWEKIVIMRESWNSKTDISTTKEQIDDYIKNDEWFIKNNWSFYLSQTDSLSWSGDLTLSGNTLSWSLTSSWEVYKSDWSSYVSFDNLYDEAEIGTDTIDIEWNVLADNVSTIEINWQQADIDTVNKKFSLKNFRFTSKVNDIVYKVYDSESKLLNKWIFTVYYSQWVWASAWSTKTDLAQVQNYPISSSPLYQIISPKLNPYTTKENIIRIEWTVPARTVEKIVINWFKLQKFPAYWSYWSYFANKDFGNLKDWVNIYKIEYYGAENKLLYENNFTIIKEVDPTSTQTWTTTETQTEVWQ